MSKNPKNWGKMMKIANTDKEFFHIFWTAWGNSMKFSGKMYFEIILKLLGVKVTLSSDQTFVYIIITYLITFNLVKTLACL